MRTMIEKRIGPVPIALVAVLALAAFISAGLWLAPGSGDVTHAQGMPAAGAAASEVKDKCGVTVFTNTATALTNGTFANDADCNITGDSADVVFQSTNTRNDASATATDLRYDSSGDGNITAADDFIRGVTVTGGLEKVGTVPMVVYVTGGTDYPNVQATAEDTTDDVDTDPDHKGKVGVDEELVTVPLQTSSFGTTTPGSVTIPVTRSMAGEDGKVYLFGYYSDDDISNVHELHAIDGKIDLNGDGVIDSSDARSAVDDDSDSTNGIAAIANLADLDRAAVIGGKLNITAIAVNTSPSITTTDDLAGFASGGTPDTQYEIVDGIMYGGKTTGTLAMTNPDGDATTTEDDFSYSFINGLLDVNGDGVITTADDRRAIDNDANSANGIDAIGNVGALYRAAVIDGKFNITQIAAGTSPTVDINDDLTGFAVALAGADTGTVQYEIVDGVMYGGITNGELPFTTFRDEDEWSLASTTQVPFAPGTTGYFPGTTPDGKNTVPADVVVVVNFRDPAVLKDAAGTTRSQLTFGGVSAAGKSTATLQVQDANGVGLSGFADLTIDAAGDDVVFEASNRKTHRVKVTNGAANATVSGLAKTGPVRVKVTATFEELDIVGNIVRMGAEHAVVAMAYKCSVASGETKAVCTAADMAKKMADRTQASTVAPGDQFIIAATVTDSMENGLNGKTVTAEQTMPKPTATAPAAIAKLSGTTASLGDDPGIVQLTATVGDKAKLGDYTIEVARGAVKTTVMVTVTGKATTIAFKEGATDPIPTNTGLGTYTVVIADENGNVPNNVSTFEAYIAVRSTGDKAPTLLGITGNKFSDFSAKTGERTFRIQVPTAATEGTTVSITVGDSASGSTIAPVTMTVTYGMATTPTPTDPAAPANVAAASFPGSGAIGVSWDAAPGNVAQYWVVVLDSNGLVVGNPAIVGKNVTTGRVTNVAAGNYTVIVAAYYSGVGFKYDFNGVPVTVN